MRWMTYEKRLTGKHGLKMKEQFLLPADLKNGIKMFHTTATEFLVIDYLGISKHIKKAGLFSRDEVLDYKGFIQFKIDTSEYFIEPDGSMSHGVSNLMYPLGDISRRTQQHTIYVLPGQTFTIGITIMDRQGEPLTSWNNEALDEDEYIDVCMGYYLFEGGDAILAIKVLEMGMQVSLENIDWLRHRIITSSENVDEAYENEWAASNNFREHFRKKGL